MTYRVENPAGKRNQNRPGTRGRLAHGNFYEGVVTDANYSSLTYTVSINDENVTGVRDATGLASSLLGIKSNWRIPVGTTVLVAYGNRPYIFSSVPADAPDSDSFLSRDITGKGVDGIPEIDPASDNEIPPHNTPKDLLEGEYELGFLQGPFIRFLLFMSSFGATERSQIQFHLLRDLTRLITNNFEHFSSAGDEKIYDNGRVTQEINGTSYPHERMGKVNVDDPLHENEPGEFDGENFDPLRTGRWRWSQYLGFLGDLFNHWFTDPTEAAGEMAQDAIRSGKSRFWAGTNGEVLVQSISEIALEKVVRIPVPIRLKHEEDPSGVLRREMEQLDRDFLKEWNQGQNGSTEHHTIFQLRAYSRYLSQYHSLARIHQLAEKKREFYVPSEEETPEPDMGAGEEDRRTTGETTYHKNAYSTIRIMNDGSILNHDAYGNTIATGAQGISIDSTRHARFMAAGDLSLTAGGSLFLGARRHLEIAAHRGGIILKSRTFLRALCERGTLWLKSDYNPDSDYDPQAGDPEAEVADENGIVIESTNSPSLFRFGKGFRLFSRGEKKSLIQVDSSLKIRAFQKLHIEGIQNIALKTTGTIRSQCSRIVHYCNSWLIPGVAEINKSIAKFRAVRSNIVEALQSLSGPQRGAIMDARSLSSEPLPPHLNHVDVVRSASLEFSEAEDFPQEDEIPEPEEMTWSLLDPKEYQWGTEGAGNKSDVNFIFEPLSQQTLRLDENEAYGKWSGMSDPILAGTRTEGGAPWPGQSARWVTCVDPGETLHEPSSRQPSSFSADPSPLTQTHISYNFLKKED